MGKYGLLDTDYKTKTVYSPTDKILSKLSNQPQSCLINSSPNKLEIYNTLKIVSDVSENPLYPNIQDIWNSIESNVINSKQFESTKQKSDLSLLQDQKNVMNSFDMNFMDTSKFKELNSKNEFMLKVYFSFQFDKSQLDLF